MKILVAVLGIVVYNIIFAWQYHALDRRDIPVFVSFSWPAVLGLVSVIVVTSFLVAMPLCKVAWNKFIPPLWNAREITLLESLHLYSLLVLVVFALRLHNVFIFVLIMISGD